MYDDYKVYGPYTRKDGRQHIVYVKEGKRITVSYPKYLMECYLGRYLSNDETIDHIDRNINNNELSNLRVISRSNHVKDDVLRNADIVIRCAFCGSEFTINGSKLSHRNRLDRGNTGYFCSKRCIGLYGKQVQDTGVKLPVQDRVPPIKYTNKMV